MTSTSVTKVYQHIWNDLHSQQSTFSTECNKVQKVMSVTLILRLHWNHLSTSKLFLALTSLEFSKCSRELGSLACICTCTIQYLFPILTCVKIVLRGGRLQEKTKETFFWTQRHQLRLTKYISSKFLLYHILKSTIFLKRNKIIENFNIFWLLCQGQEHVEALLIREIFSEKIRPLSSSSSFTSLWNSKKLLSQE